MLQRKNRLSAKVRLQTASLLHSPYFTLRFAANGLLYNRYGFIVSKRVDRLATVRNRTKRILRSCIEERLTRVKPGIDMLFFLKKEAVLTKHEVLSQQIDFLFKKQGFYV